MKGDRMEITKERAELLKKRKELKDRLKCVREEYKAGAFETRSKDEVEGELENLISQITEMDTEIEKPTDETTSDKQLETVSSEEGRTKNMNMSREQIIASPEYRDAFLSNLMGRPVAPEIRTTYLDSSVTQGVIPLLTAEKIMETLVKTAPMLNEITLLRVAGNLRFAVEGTRAAAALHTENAAITPASDTITYVDLGGYEIVKLQRISATVASLSMPAFENWLVGALAADVGRIVENYIINGSGSSQPKGVEYARTWTDNSTGVDFGTAVTYDHLVKLISLLPAGYDSNAKFLMGKAFLYNQIAKVQDANGMPILVRDFTNGMQMRLMGYPVLVSDKVAADTAYLGDYSKVVGNLAQDIKVDKSVESAFASNAVDYRGVCLFDCDIAIPEAFVKLFT
jgi:HK97 family phage major capsid protein